MDGRRPARGTPLPPRSALWIGWGAMALAVVTYAGVGLVVAEGHPPVAAGLPVWLLPALAAAAAFAAVLLQLRRTIAGDPDGAPSAVTARSALTGAVVVWALDDAVAIIGLVALLTGAAPRLFAIYLAAALALLVLHRPRG